MEPADWEICCGSAGIYNMVKPEAAAELGRRKAQNLLDTGAEAVVAANPGCALQIPPTRASSGTSSRWSTRSSCSGDPLADGGDG